MGAALTIRDDLTPEALRRHAQHEPNRRAALRMATRTLAQPTLNIGLIEVLPVRLPPLAEQHRMVAMGAALMALCDQLDTSIAETEANRSLLLQAPLVEACAAPARPGSYCRPSARHGRRSGSRLQRWVRLAVLDRALAVLNGCLRLARGRRWRPTAGILDTQSVKTGPQGGARGYDAAKRVRGRKRVLLVDTEGLAHGLRVVPASVQDRDTPAMLKPEVTASSLLTVWADLGFNGGAAAAPLLRQGIDLELAERKDKTGFAVEPRRREIEQTFGALQRYRRLLVDHKGSTGTFQTMMLIASLFMSAARFERQITA
jgi:transposase